MKRLFTNLVLAVLITTVLTVTLTAGDKENFSEKETKNLIAGIQSENDGLQRSSIYFAGKYKVQEAVNVLTEELSEDNTPSTKVLIALALYEIGDESVLQNLIELVNTDTENQKVRKMAKAVYEYWVTEKANSVAAVAR